MEGQTALTRRGQGPGGYGQGEKPLVRGTKTRTHDVGRARIRRSPNARVTGPASLPDPIPSPFEPEPRSGSETRAPKGSRIKKPVPESPTEIAVPHPPAHLLPRECTPLGPIPRSPAFTRGGAGAGGELSRCAYGPPSKQKKKKRAEIERARGPLTNPYPNRTRGATSPVLSNPLAFAGPTLLPRTSLNDRLFRASSRTITPVRAVFYTVHLDQDQNERRSAPDYTCVFPHGEGRYLRMALRTGHRSPLPCSLTGYLAHRPTRTPRVFPSPAGHA
ncbi:hypothetical protein BHM03_00006250 [Ensete ventricosum]|nr:hypothetical protein BHM03_00006250 [Ensete ventricosum]